jgi:peptidoglycan hydrolase-like protein with peptidoglycan-binding domain
MKKPVIIGFASLIALVAGIAPVASVANAQTYYPTTPYSSVSACIYLTAYQTLGSSDAQTGGQVSELQQFLNREGYLSGVSGYFDNGTYGAVINFQNSHGIEATGTVGPETRAAIQQVSCGGVGYVSPAVPISPISPVSTSGQSCYSTGSTYVCSYTPVSSYPTVYPVSTPAYNSVYPNTVYPNGYTNTGTPTNEYYPNGNYSNSNTCSYSYVNNVYGYYCGNNEPVIDSFSSSYNNTGVTITVTGTGFSSTNTVHFGSQTLTGIYSNGSTLVFTIPYTQEYTNGSYPVTVTNAQGVMSNSLSFTMNDTGYYNNNAYYNNNGYNNGSYNYSAPSVSSISGPTSVQVGSTNTWSVTTNNSNGQYETVQANFGDNQGSNNSNIQQGYSSQSSYSFSHTYETPGNYVLTVTATNSNGASSSSSLNVYVSSNGNYYYSY